jgi:hypothetical protein
MVEGEGSGAKTAQPTAGQKAKKPRKPRAVSANGDDEKVRAIQTIVASKRFIVVAETDEGTQVLTTWA